jgi:hypothetical protein
MNLEVNFQTAFCNEYESLLHECHSAKETCSEWRTKMSVTADAHLNREIGSELIRLQANYAKAYARLEQHQRECELCQFVTKMSAHQRECVHVADSVEVPRTA